jgi:hypothetical protein
MADGTDFKADIYLNNKLYSSKFEVEDEIKDLDRLINDYEAELKMFASSNPKDIIPKEWKEEQPIDWLNITINEKLDGYMENIIHQYKLTLYLEYLNENNIVHIEHKSMWDNDPIKEDFIVDNVKLPYNPKVNDYDVDMPF